MRLLIAGLVALAAFAFAVPAFAQQQEPAAAPAPAPVPKAKPKAGTTAYCQKLKGASSRSACLKKLHARAKPKATTKPKTTTRKKAKKTTPAPAPRDVGQLGTPAANPVPAPVPAPTGGTVPIPPLPQKTI